MSIHVWLLNCFNFIVMRCVCAAQARVHSMLCFLHEHLSVLQSVWQLHLITCSRCSGAGGSDVRIGTNPSSHSCHPQFMGSSFIVKLFHSWIWRYTWRLWYFGAAEVGGSDCGFTLMFLKLLFHRTAYVIENPMYQSSFHCILVLELSLLHLSHHVWKLNLNGTRLPAHRTYCLFWTCLWLLLFQSHQDVMLYHTQE